MSAPIPIIDLAKFASSNKQDRDSVISEWDLALKTYGFAYVINHCVSHEARKNLYEDAKSFFNKSADEKDKYDKKMGYGNGGYVPIGVEKVAKSIIGTENQKPATPDIVENIVFRNAGLPPDIMPREPTRLSKSVDTYWTEVNQFYWQMAELSACALGTELKDKHIQNFFLDPTLFLRLAYYPSKELTESLEEKSGAMRYGAHTDYTGFTLLLQDDVGGLQVLIKNDRSNMEHETTCVNNSHDGGACKIYSDLDKDVSCCSWVPIPFLEGSYVINAGDLVQRWTNDTWISNTHRVVPTEGSQKDRLSIVVFTGPANESMVEVLPNCVSEERPKRYPPISARQHLANKINRSNM